ncbi:MAG: hypothetical protein ACUZ8H_13240 [Candidatus Anammoxibacter sp.]
MNNSFKANFSATAIGSFPHERVEDACDLVLRTIPEVPCWPQLAARSVCEEMCIQYTEGLPGFKVDPEQKIGLWDTSGDFDSDLEVFYNKYLEKDINHFAISPKYSSGFKPLLDLIEKTGTEKLRAIKGQIVGPITLAGITKDKNKIAVINDNTGFDAIVKMLAMKACWQLEQFKKFNVTKIIFVDEPYLAGIGSAFANIKTTQVVDSLNEVFNAIHESNGLAGIHCCGNTDWAMLINTTVDIVNFDAYGYMDALLLYWRDVKAFLERGGILAWGIVPTTEDINKATVNSLVSKMESGIDKLISKGIDPTLIYQNSLITPSCGTGSLDCENAEKSMLFVRDVSMKLKEKLV